MKKLVAGGLALSLLFAFGTSEVDAKQKFVDKNKNGISDKWEKKYKLKGKKLAKLDADKDGLSNFVEYKLNLNPKKKDTNKNGKPDGLEDSDKDGLTNIAEVGMGLKPYKKYSKNSRIADGNLKDENGVKFSEKVSELEISIESGKNEFELEYEVKDGKEKIKLKQKGFNLEKEAISKLVVDLEKAVSDRLTEDQILEMVQTRFALTGAFEIEVELEYANGDEFEFEKEVDLDDDQADDQDSEDDEQDED